MKGFQISFAVAVLLGLTSAQLLNATAPTLQEQAILSITRVDPALLNGTATPIVGASVTKVPTQQDLLLQQISSFQPDVYLDQVLGLTAPVGTTTTTGSTVNAAPLSATVASSTAPLLGATTTPVAASQTTQQQYAALVKTDLMTKMQAQKDQMMIDYIDEMVQLQTNMAAEATKLKGCNWTCVDTCALTQTALAKRVACLEQCGCYGQQQQNSQAQSYAQSSSTNLQLPKTGAVALHSHLSFLASPTTNTAIQTVQSVESAFATPPTPTVGLTTTAQVDLTATAPVVPLIPVDPYVALQQQHDAQRLLLDQQIVAAGAKINAEELAATTATLTPLLGAAAAKNQAFNLARKSLHTQAQQSRQLLQLDFEAQEEALEFAEEEKNFAANSIIANSYIATLPKNIQDLYNQNKIKEKQLFEREKLASKVQRSLTVLSIKKTGTAADFQLQVDQAAVQLGCDSVCVQGCSATQTTLNGKSSCLDTCMCYLDPTERAQMAAFIPKYAVPAAAAPLSTNSASWAPIATSIAAPTIGSTVAVTDPTVAVNAAPIATSTVAVTGTPTTSSTAAPIDGTTATATTTTAAPTTTSDTTVTTAPTTTADPAAKSTAAPTTTSDTTVTTAPTTTADPSAKSTAAPTTTADQTTTPADQTTTPAPSTTADPAANSTAAHTTTADQTTTPAPTTTADQTTTPAPTTTADQNSTAAPTTTADQTTTPAPTTTADQTTTPAPSTTADPAANSTTAPSSQTNGTTSASSAPKSTVASNETQATPSEQTAAGNSSSQAPATEPAAAVATEASVQNSSATTNETASVNSEVISKPVVAAVVSESVVELALVIEAPLASITVAQAPAENTNNEIVATNASITTVVAESATVEIVAQSASIETFLAPPLAGLADPSSNETVAAAPVSLFNYNTGSNGLSYSFMAFLSALFVAMIGVALYIRKNSKKFNLDDDNSTSEYLLLRA